LPHTITLTDEEIDALDELAGWYGAEGSAFPEGHAALGEHALVSTRELCVIAGIAHRIPERR